MIQLSAQLILEELISSDLFSDNCQLKEIKGGAVNKSYQLLDNDRLYFVKSFTSDEMVNIDRTEQFTQQQHLALLGMCATPHYLSSTQSFQVDTWSEGLSLLDADLTGLQKYRYLAQTLVNIHNIENTAALALPSLDLPTKWQEYLSLSQMNLTATESNQLRQWAKVWSDTDPADLRVCHNDLSLQHVLVGESRIVFDWEYAAYSNRYFDIASSLLINRATLECEQCLLLEYSKITGIDLAKIIQQVTVMKSLAALTNKLWFKAADKQLENKNGS
ncbi:phosphotransferase [Paraglaciecola sp. L3A3]|uniref:phosphotransferase n=1 Tax=Paraglaciecola sp. L3A3 TaxID=2686358 RepID=UPI00131C1330|nr:phosphotransferase [Paraglaciecola sp. L3A3]